MIEIITAPNITKSKGVKLFLAGGISNCPLWQEEIILKLTNEVRLKKFDDINIIIYNPRCENEPEANSQIIWEFDKLGSCDIISFWFSVGSLNPITLFEYGCHFKLKKKIIVGCHKDYLRKFDVILQTKLATKLKVHENFDSFYNEIVDKLLIQCAKYKFKQFFNPITNIFS